MSSATFGRKQTADGAALAARRAAFIAEERARATQLTQRSAPEGLRPAPGSSAVLVREKRVGTAYLLWFFFGGLSVHRFYLGYSTSGAIQASLPVIGYALLFGGSLAGLVFTAAACLWILADAFIIPSMVREANARVRRDALGPVFA